MSEIDSDKPKFYVSLGMKINTGNYENQDLSFGISNIPVDCSAEYLQAATEAAIARQRVILDALAAEMDKILREVYGR